MGARGWVVMLRDDGKQILCSETGAWMVWDKTIYTKAGKLTRWQINLPTRGLKEYYRVQADSFEKALEQANKRLPKEISKLKKRVQMREWLEFMTADQQSTCDRSNTWFVRFSPDEHAKLWAQP